MKIQSINNTQSFGAIVRIKNIEEFAKEINKMIELMPPSARAASGSSVTTTGSGIMTAGTATNTAATGSDVIGSAFSLQASNVDSFGIVPSVLEKMTPYATPQTVASSAENPSIAGGLFSTAGGWLHKHFKFISAKQTKKFPS